MQIKHGVVELNFFWLCVKNYRNQICVDALLSTFHKHLIVIVAVVKLIKFDFNIVSIVSTNRRAVTRRNWMKQNLTSDTMSKKAMFAATSILTCIAGAGGWWKAEVFANFAEQFASREMLKSRLSL